MEASPDLVPAVPRRPLPPPSSIDAALGPHPLPGAPPAFLVRAGIIAYRGLRRLADALLPAHLAMLERSIGLMQTMALSVAARHGVADLLDGGPLSAAEIAARTGTDADAMHRLLRALAALGVFALRPDGRFENDRLSRTLRSGDLHRLREWVQYLGSQSNVAAWADLAGSVAPGAGGDGCAFERALGAVIWDWFERHPDERETFAHAMMGLTIADAPVVARLYPFAEVRTVCDVGGGRGTLLSEILVRHPHLSGILCDAAGVLESARPLLERRGVAGRVELRPGNFFEDVPAGADAYLLKSILHDWDDARCRTILSAVRRAARPGARVLLVESQIERNDFRHPAALADLQMMVVCSGGRERSAGELQALLRDAGFAPARVFAYPTMGIVEGVAR